MAIYYITNAELPLHCYHSDCN